MCNESRERILVQPPPCFLSQGLPVELFPDAPSWFLVYWCRWFGLNVLTALVLAASPF